MRSYPSNSPRAAARIVALAALADGHFSRSELSVLERLDAAARLGLARDELYEVVQHLSEDLLATAWPQWGTACRIEPEFLHSLLAEITDPALRRETLELAAAVAGADYHLAEAEANVISTAALRWLMDNPVLQAAR